MNLLKVYIKEIYEEESYKFDEEKYPELKGIDFVKVKYKGNCHGRESDIETVVNEEDWEWDKKRGYSMR